MIREQREWGGELREKRGQRPRESRGQRSREREDRNKEGEMEI